MTRTDERRSDSRHDRPRTTRYNLRNRSTIAYKVRKTADSGIIGELLNVHSFDLWTFNVLVIGK